VLTKPLTTARKTSYALFAALVVAACWMQLGPVVLAGLFSYMLLDLIDRRLGTFMPPFAARTVSVVVFTLTALSLAWLFGQFVRLSLQRLPVIIGSVLPTLDAFAERHGFTLPFDDLQGLRATFLRTLTENARSVTQFSGLLTRDFFQVVVGIFIAVANFLSSHESDSVGTFYDELGLEFDRRMQLFMACYEKVLGAQVVISLINTAITALFVAIVDIPYLHFLTLSTFILGVVPLVGNVATNAIIVGAALTVSPQKGLAAFIFLIVSHKAQYFLNSRIIGSTLKTPMWMTLLGLLIGEVVLGIPGLILAPAVLAYVREELALLPVKPSSKAA